MFVMKNQSWKIRPVFTDSFTIVTESEKISLIAHVSRFNFWIEWYMSKFHVQNKLHLSGLLLLVWSTMVICMNGLLSKWRLGRLWVAAVVLNKGVCCIFPFILKTCVAHNLANASLCLSLKKKSSCLPPSSTHVGTESTPSKNYLKWWET